MLSVKQPGLLNFISMVPIGICTFADPVSNKYMMVVKATKEALLAVKLKKTIHFYLAKFHINDSIAHTLVTAFPDDDFDPLMLVTPLLQDEMAESILQMLSYESFDIHFFDENNRELLAYKARNPSYKSFNPDDYSLAASTIQNAEKLVELGRYWFSLRDHKDDESAIKLEFIESIIADDIAIMDLTSGRGITHSGGSFFISMLEREEPGSFQESDIARLLSRNFFVDLIYINPLRTDNNEEFVDVLVSCAGYNLLVQAKDSPNTEHSMNRSLQRKRKTVSKSLDKAIMQTRGAARYLKKSATLEIHFGNGTLYIQTAQSKSRCLIVLQEVFDDDRESYSKRVLALSKDIGIPCLFLGYAELNDWTSKLEDAAAFNRAFDTVYEKGLESGFIQPVTFKALAE